MFTEPRIVNPCTLDQRAYVLTYVNGIRFRIYNGSILNIKCNPNRCASLRDREKALKQLQFGLKKRLEQGWTPDQRIEPVLEANVAAEAALSNLREAVQREALSPIYLRDLLSIADKLLEFLRQRNLHRSPISQLTHIHIAAFLDRFKSSGTNYMNKRRTLSSLFARLMSKGIIDTNPVLGTGRVKEAHQLNLAFKPQELREVLRFIKSQHPPLYLCCLLMYGCMLRPHREIRLLTKGSLVDDMRFIMLGGDQNKSRRTRTVPVPGYVKEQLVEYRISLLSDEQNIFTRVKEPYNASYFNTAWSRIKAELLKLGIIGLRHTMYSFRHTAAINMYMKTRDAFKIQRAFGHSSLGVTLIYLRSLGLLIDTNVDDLPDLG